MKADDLRAAVPDLTGTVRLPELESPVEICRDAWGIPHVWAQTVHDAFVAQGFVHAQDRLWQMDYDRRRAYGRWAEWAGTAAQTQDRLMRRLRLEASARADYAAVTPETRAMLDAYAEGVNAFLRTTARLPIEYRLLDTTPEPWQPWDACAVFKIRHVFTGGVWQAKLWRARLLRLLGPERTARLCQGDEPGQPLILPPGFDAQGPALKGLEELAAGHQVLARLDEPASGSNNWVVAGHRTASGKPLLAGDPHRAIDTPNVFYQNHLACPAFDAIGFSFPGVPGLPHFGHNRHVAWGITTTMADYQDLYIERFKPDDPRQYEHAGRWWPADIYPEVIRVRGGQPVTTEVVVTRHGPILFGNPAHGHALAFRYTAIDGPNVGFDALLPMLSATSADALEEAMRPWVDPCNNLLFADVHGHIGYRLRGQIPIRSRANAWLPVPGWTGAHEWQGVIPFDAMPHVRDPEAGMLVTANNRVVDDTYPHYIALHYEAGFRARRIRDRLSVLTQAGAEDMVAIHADRASIPAQAFVGFLSGVTPPDPLSSRAKALLQAWDGTMAVDSVAATIYAVWREHLMQLLTAPWREELAREVESGEPRGGLTHLGRLRARLTEMIRTDERILLPTGMDWPTALGRALFSAVGWLRQELGDDPHAWQWGRIHRTAPRHPLSGIFPEWAARLDPPAVSVGGDSDTVQAAGFPVGAGYHVHGTSVARYVFDLADWSRSLWSIPLGASGHPGSPHYADQVGAWAAARSHPMLYDWARIRREAETRQHLTPLH